MAEERSRFCIGPLHPLNHLLMLVLGRFTRLLFLYCTTQYHMASRLILEDSIFKPLILLTHLSLICMEFLRWDLTVLHHLIEPISETFQIVRDIVADTANLILQDAEVGLLGLICR